MAQFTFIKRLGIYGKNVIQSHMSTPDQTFLWLKKWLENYRHRIIFMKNLHSFITFWLDYEVQHPFHETVRLCHHVLQVCMYVCIYVV